MSKEHSDHLVYKEVDFDPFGSNDVLMVPTTEAQREIWTNVQFGGHAANCAYNESVYTPKLDVNPVFTFAIKPIAPELGANTNRSLKYF